MGFVGSFMNFLYLIIYSSVFHPPNLLNLNLFNSIQGSICKQIHISDQCYKVLANSWLLVQNYQTIFLYKLYKPIFYSSETFSNSQHTSIMFSLMTGNIDLKIRIHNAKWYLSDMRRQTSPNHYSRYNHGRVGSILLLRIQLRNLTQDEHISG